MVVMHQKRQVRGVLEVSLQRTKDYYKAANRHISPLDQLKVLS